MRKPGSIVRERIKKILAIAEKAYGYEIYKIYNRVYGDVLMRTIYYNLKKGVEERDFELIGILNVPGDFTWGFETNRIYYKNRENVALNLDEETYIKKAIKDIKKEMKEEVKKWVAKAIKEVKKRKMNELEKTKLLAKLKKIKKFYEENFGRYPEELDKWMNSLTP